MISIFEFSHVNKYLLARIHEMPKSGYGQSKKISEFLNVHTTLVSQALKATKSFTLEQGALLCEYFGLNEMETEYFILLLQLERAGNEPLRKNIKKSIV